MKKVDAIVQARMSSTRLPGKILKTLKGKTLLEHVLERVRASNAVDRVIVATTVGSADEDLCAFLEERGILFFRGSEEDVLARFHGAAAALECENICRITPDDPFKDPRIIDQVAEMFHNQDLVFAYNNHPPTFPEGLDTEIFTFPALDRAHRESTDPFEREHMTQYLYRHPDLFRQANLIHEGPNLSHHRWTIDTLEDLEMANRVFAALYREKSVFHMDDVLDLLDRNPDIAKINSSVVRSYHYR